MKYPAFLPILSALTLPLLSSAQSTHHRNADMAVTHDHVTGTNTVSWFGKQDHAYFLLTSDDLLNWAYINQIFVGADATEDSFNFVLSGGGDKAFVRLNYTDFPVADPYGGDIDGDTISNQTELDNGTDPFSALDLSGNGIPDDADTLWAGVDGSWITAIVNDSNSDFYDPDGLITSAGDVSPIGDYDGDGISNLQEYLDGTDAMDFFNGDGANAVLKIIRGTPQTAAPNTFVTDSLFVRVENANGDSLYNAPVRFSVDGGHAGLSRSKLTSTLAANLTAPTLPMGSEVYFYTPDIASGTSPTTITASLPNGLGVTPVDFIITTDFDYTKPPLPPIGFTKKVQADGSVIYTWYSKAPSTHAFTIQEQNTDGEWVNISGPYANSTLTSIGPNRYQYELLAGEFDPNANSRVYGTSSVNNPPPSPPSSPPPSSPQSPNSDDGPSDENDPSLIDSDGDGLSDHDEIHYFGSDPENKHSDADDIEDGDDAVAYDPFFTFDRTSESSYAVVDLGANGEPLFVNNIGTVIFAPESDQFRYQVLGETAIQVDGVPLGLNNKGDYLYYKIQRDGAVIFYLKDSLGTVLKQFSPPDISPQYYNAQGSQYVLDYQGTPPEPSMWFEYDFEGSGFSEIIGFVDDNGVTYISLKTKFRYFRQRIEGLTLEDAYYHPGYEEDITLSVHAFYKDGQPLDSSTYTFVDHFGFFGYISGIVNLNQSGNDFYSEDYVISYCSGGAHDCDTDTYTGVFPYIDHSTADRLSGPALFDETIDEDFQFSTSSFTTINSIFGGYYDQIIFGDSAYTHSRDASYLLWATGNLNGQEGLWKSWGISPFPQGDALNVLSLGSPSEGMPILERRKGDQVIAKEISDNGLLKANEGLWRNGRILTDDQILGENSEWTDLSIETISDDGSFLVGIGQTAVSGSRILLLTTVSLESDRAASGLYFGDEDNRIEPILLKNPAYFIELSNADIDPCDTSRSDPALVVFREDVLGEGDSIVDFNVELSVGDTSESNVVQWEKFRGPNSGILINPNNTQAVYQNPKEGGLYQFDVTISGQSIRTSLLLPLAGADLTDWLQAEIASIEPWARAHRRNAEDANYSNVPFVTAYELYRVWSSISGSYFDYTIDAVDANELAPCRRFQSPISSSAEYGYVTLSGHVVHGSKINVMLWAVFGHYWGYSHFHLLAGSIVNELSANMQLDPESTRYAIGLGTTLYWHDDLDLRDEWAVEAVRNLQEPIDLIEEKLWPSPYLYDTNKSTLERPDPDLPIVP